MRTLIGVASIALTLVTTTAPGQPVERDAAQLGGPELTPLGAERAGNEAGTIPPWTGGITKPPEGYRAGERHRDPYPDDEILFTITAENYEQHAAHLTEGQKALFRTYPETWRMNVYRTRRSASYPGWVYDGVMANATTAELITEGRGGVRRATISSPFPIPQRGVEVVWNHTLRWRGVHVERTNGQAPVTRRGLYRVVMSEDQWALPYGARGPTPFDRKNPDLLLAVKIKFIQPALQAGDGLLVLDNVDQNTQPRRAWFYRSNLKRVFRSPFTAYDHPAINTDGLRTVDEFDMYNGAPDRFEWSLQGKQELYIPYNAYRLHGEDVAYRDILSRGHINPDLARYELHRVRVVNGALKPKARHIYQRRVFYVDEDSWQIAVADSYDHQGEIWRVAEAHALNYYEVPVLWTTLEVFHDLRQRRYLASGLDNTRNGYRFSESLNPRQFTPNALNYYVR